MLNALSRNTSVACRRYDLAERFFTDVSRGENAWNFCFHLSVCFNVAFFICDAQVLERFRKRKHTDINKDAVSFEFFLFSRHGIHKSKSADFSVFLMDFFYGFVPFEVNFLIVKGTRLKNALRTQFVTSVNDGDF